MIISSVVCRIIYTIAAHKSLYTCLFSKHISIVFTSVEALKRSLARKWAKIPQEHYRAAVDEFQRKLDMVIDGKGSHIENEVID